MLFDPGPRANNRRQFLQGAGIGIGLPLVGMLEQNRLAQGAPGGTPRSPIRACILLFCYGGPSHLDTFDLKPQGPLEIRGEFQPISTSVSGLQISEHLPQTARLMQHAALIRSIHHGNRLHDSASTEALTGRPPLGGDRENFAPVPEFFPSFGSTVAYLGREQARDVAYASLPWVFQNVLPVPCQGGGFLGRSFDPLRIAGDPATSSYRADFSGPADLTIPRLGDRRRLLGRLESESSSLETAGTRELRGFYERAFQLMQSQTIRDTLRIEQEDPRVRERYGLGGGFAAGGTGGADNAYGRNLRGQNLLLARRLVESGVPFVTVYDFKQQGQNWDAHAENFKQHKDHLLPPLDRAVSALIEDLEQRGLLESTLLVVMGEFGRTPKINKNAGRDHWPDCYSVFLAGGGVKGGFVYGASDKLGAYPDEYPVTPADLAATIYWRFGFDPKHELHDLFGRPYRLAEGRPITDLFVA